MKVDNVFLAIAIALNAYQYINCSSIYHTSLITLQSAEHLKNYAHGFDLNNIIYIV